MQDKVEQRSAECYKTSFFHMDTVAWAEDKYNNATDTPNVYARQYSAECDNTGYFYMNSVAWEEAWSCQFHR